jgi:glycosyltransferase involved in cell wall biosynthesis
MCSDRRVLIIIPAYNEAESIGGVIDGIKNHAPWADIVVVNDGSLDATARIAEAKGAFVLNLPYNLGIGGAVQTGYKFASDQGYDIAVQVDGDGQHPAEEIPKLLSVLQTEQADMAIGSRFVSGCSGYQVPFARLVGIKILSAFILLLSHQRITDPTSGFRAVNRDAIRLLARMYPRDYPEPEVVVLLYRAGYSIAEVPVKMNQRVGGTSSITLLGGLFYIVKVLLAIAIDIVKLPAGPKTPSGCVTPAARSEEEVI